MKQLFFYLLLFATPLLTQCDDDDHAVETLPEATQTGRGIFACLVDGKPFIDTSGNPNGISFNAYYQLVDGEYYFGIGGEDDKVNNIILVGLTSNQLPFNENFNYSLVDNIPGNVSGICSFFPNINSQEFSLTNSNYTGELKITKFNLTNQIISGTFWFDIQDPFTGERVEIREGRFDTRFGL
jgi:hypothetical protein